VSSFRMSAMSALPGHAPLAVISVFITSSPQSGF
jgi:hypothetical protein